jgi:hypothetical protein
MQCLTLHRGIAVLSINALGDIADVISGRARTIIRIPILILIMLWLLSQKGEAVRKTCGDATSKVWRADE